MNYAATARVLEDQVLAEMTQVSATLEEVQPLYQVAQLLENQEIASELGADIAALNSRGEALQQAARILEARSGRAQV
jgi:hypothetical protein